MVTTKILLIQPPIQDFYETSIRLQPIGLAYLKAAIHQHLPQCSVSILDAHHGWGRKTISLPKELSYLKPYYAHADESPFCSFHHYYHFGASFEKIAEIALKEKPSIVGISSLFSPYYREALTTASVVKKATGAIIIMGGSHVSAQPEMMLAHPDVDFIIRGEGEKSFVIFLQEILYLESGGKHWLEGSWERVPGLGYKLDEKLFLNDVAENFPVLPIPDLSDFSPSRYQLGGKPMSFVVTSRSCPHHCSFCSVHTTFGNNYRRTPVNRVIEEMHKRYSEGYRVFDFEDDNLTYYRDDMKELCKKIIETFPPGELRLVAMNGISYLSLDTELLQLMQRAGFTDLNLALVSSDQTVRQTTKRPHTIKKYLEVIEEASRLGFHLTSYQILGLPLETLESMIQTLCFNAKLPVLLGASMFYLTPNSPLARQLNHRASPEDVFKSRLTAMAIETDHFDRDDLYTLFVTTRILNFIKGLSKTSSTRSQPRQKKGLEILGHLFSTGELLASTAQGMRSLPRFKARLFFQVWNQLDWIITQDGSKLDLDEINAESSK